MASSGSSPLTRGKRCLTRRTSRRVGLIPAHAGKTNASRQPLAPHPAHPRSRGENGASGSQNADAWGSSPLTRGKLLVGRFVQSAAGLIPAHAGKTLIGGGDERVHWAHPRSRGENVVAGLRYVGRMGSSPLTRGKLSPSSETTPLMGLIPAHAGKTRARLSPDWRVRAHPRSRGENLYGKLAASLTGGSSPLTRGKLARTANSSPRTGLIPAHAGKTPKPKKHCAPRRAHPRSRGENLLPAFHSVEPRGSSPLTRGKRDMLWQQAGRTGLIPAHAGKTAATVARVVTAGAHPRSRGENALAGETIVRVPGSSPLTRGKPGTRRSAQLDRGLIPAHAGKTSEAEAFCDSSRAHPRSRGENMDSHVLI